MPKYRKRKCSVWDISPSKKNKRETNKDLVIRFFRKGGQKAEQKFEQICYSDFCPPMESEMEYLKEEYEYLFEEGEGTTPVAVLIKMNYMRPYLKVLWGIEKKDPIMLVFTMEHQIPSIFVSCGKNRKTVEAPPLLLNTLVQLSDEYSSVEEIFFGYEFISAKKVLTKKKTWPKEVTNIVLGYIGTRL